MPTSKSFRKNSDAGKRKLLIRVSSTMKPASSATATPSLTTAKDSACGPACGAIAPTISSSGTTARSCATSTAMVSLPARVCDLGESSIILIARAVEEIASMKPITTALVVSPLVSCASAVVKPVKTTISATAMPIASGSSLRNDRQPQLHAEDEQQHQHAQIGERLDGGRMRDQPEAGRPQHHAHQDEPRHRRQAHAVHHQPRDHRGGQHERQRGQVVPCKQSSCRMIDWPHDNKTATATRNRHAHPDGREPRHRPRHGQAFFQRRLARDHLLAPRLPGELPLGRGAGVASVTGASAGC